MAELSELYGDKNLKELEQLTSSIEEIEKAVLDQLDSLGKSIPEIYGGYAEIVREITSATMTFVQMAGKDSSNYQRIGEAIARGVEAFGAYKAAKKHNEMLDKLLKTKKEYAQANLNQVNYLHKKVGEIIDSVFKLFEKRYTTNYNIANSSSELMVSASNLMLRCLNLYRMNLYFNQLCIYLKAEFGAWIRGEQTSKKQLPDYHMVNEKILEIMFGKGQDAPFKALENAADKTSKLSGAEFMLLADQQLMMTVFDQVTCEIDLEAATPQIRAVLENNKAVNYYKIISYDILRLAKKNPVNTLRVLSFFTFVLIVLIVLEVLPSAWPKIIVGAAATGALIRIYNKNAIRVKISYIKDFSEQAEAFDEEVLKRAGAIEKQEVDYEKRDALSEAINTFLGN